MKATGNCFETAWKEAERLDADDEEVRIVHAEVTGDGVVPRHAHAWVEFRVRVPGIEEIWRGIDFWMARDVANGHDIQFPADAYRNIGDATRVHEYTLDEARAAMLEHGHYGPWGWDTSTGL